MRGRMTTAEKLVTVLIDKKLTCATAESCTGGGVGYAITGVPESSAVFMGGIISYDNSVKQRVLGVPEEVLATKGAVSSECAAAMAEGVRDRIATDLAVSITGIAGPGGGSAEKPVGLVWFGLASKTGTITEKKIFPGDREAVRTAAIEHALNLLLDAVGRDAVDAATGISWEYAEQGGEVTIQKCILQKGVSDDVVIPAVLGGKPVTRIGDKAFEDCRLKSVTIPDGVTSIGKWSFCRCEVLESVKIADSVKELGANCFLHCKSLKSIRLPQGIKSLPRVFHDCQNLSVKVPEGVRDIAGFDVFDRVKSVTLPRSLRRFGRMYFINYGKKYAYSRVHETEFIWMGSPGMIDGAQDGIDAIDAHDKACRNVPEVPFAKSPLYKEAREVASVLSDAKASLNERSQVWKMMMRSDFSIPCPSSPRRVTLPEVLLDHPFGRYWGCMKKLAVRKDLCCAVPAVFRVDTKMYEEDSVAWKRWVAVIDAIEKDVPGKALLELSVKGTKLPKRLVMYALKKEAKKFLAAFYGRCPKTMQSEFPIRQMLFYVIYSFKLQKAIEYVNLLGEIAPGLIRNTLDARGNSALWYTLYREAEDGQMWPSTFSANNKLAAALIKLGCDPKRKNALGLSWADVVE